VLPVNEQNRKETAMRNFLVKVAAGLTVAAVCTFAGCLWGESRERARLVQVDPPAVVRITGQLERLLANADRMPTNAVTDAKAVVAIRRDSRSSLSTLGSLLNSDIDVLAQQLDEYQRLDASYRMEELPDRRGELAARMNLLERDILQTLQVLSRKWPAKQEQIKTEIRKIISELGYEPAS
jgi:hypothetical protein